MGQVEELQAQLQQLQQLNGLRAQVVLGLVIDGLEGLNAAAAAGNPQARATLDKLARAFAAMPAAKHGITLVTPPPGGTRNNGGS